MDCPICCNKYNKVKHKRIVCPYCPSEGCRKCFQQHILNESSSVCFNKDKLNGEFVCQKQWTREFIVKSFTQSWVAKEWSEMVKTNYFEREKVLLPETQPIVESYYKIDKLRKQIRDKKLLIVCYDINIMKLKFMKMITKPSNYIILATHLQTLREKMHKKYRELSSFISFSNLYKCSDYQLELFSVEKENQTTLHLIDLFKLIENKYFTVYPGDEDQSIQSSVIINVSKLIDESTLQDGGEFFKKHLDHYQKLKRDCNKDIDYCKSDIRDNERVIWNIRCGHPNEKVKKSKKFIGRCCTVDNCRGFLDESWECGLCGSITCKDCLQIINDDKHVCKKDDVETAKMLKLNTKPCPKCHILIYKIDGCDQMWCTQCHVGFSWKKGTIETNIHNPHYFEWLRNGGNDADVDRVHINREGGCDNLNHYNVFNDLLNKIPKKIDDGRYDVHKKYQIRKAIETVFRNIRHLRDVQSGDFNPYGDEVNNLNYRISYLENKINLEEFKSLIMKNYKQHDKKQDIYNVITLFIQGVTDIMIRGFHESNKNYDLLQNMLREMFCLKDYCNDILKNITKTYKCKKYQLHLIETTGWNDILFEDKDKSDLGTDWNFYVDYL